MAEEPIVEQYVPCSAIIEIDERGVAYKAQRVGLSDIIVNSYHVSCRLDRMKWGVDYAGFMIINPGRERVKKNDDKGVLKWILNGITFRPGYIFVKKSFELKKVSFIVAMEKYMGMYINIFLEQCPLMPRK